MRTSALFVFAGVMFAAYPALRPYSSETGIPGAEAFASPAWVAAHICAILGFIALGLAVQYSRASDFASVSTWIGIGLVLPYYGAETFALNEIGRSALDHSDPGLLDLAEPIRYSAIPMVTFGVGLVLIAVGAIAFARQYPHATVLATGFVLFLPQFYAPPALRIAHGLMILVGALLFVRAQRRSPAQSPAGARDTFQKSA